MAYIDDLKAILGITDASQDALLGLYCDAAEAEILVALNLDSMALTSYTDKVEVEEASRSAIRLPRCPVASITSIDNDGEVIDSSDVHIKADRWLVLNTKTAITSTRGGPTWSVGNQAVDVTYIAGYASTPKDLSMAIVLLAKSFYEGSDDKQSETIGAYSYKKFDRGEAEGEWPMVVRRIISKYLPIIPGR